MTDKFQEMLKTLRKVVKETEEKEKRTREALERKKAAIVVSTTKYVRMKVENEKLEKKLDLQWIQRDGQKNKGVPYLSHVEKELNENLNKMGAVLKEYENDVADEQEIVVSMLRLLRDIPINFSDEAMKEKMTQLEELKLTIQQIIDQQSKEIDKEREESEAEEERGKKLLTTLDDFGRDLKGLVIKFEAELRQRQRQVHK